VKETAAINTPYACAADELVCQVLSKCEKMNEEFLMTILLSENLENLHHL
jgi:hypothetical protein